MDHIKSYFYPKRGKRKDKYFKDVLFVDPGIGGTGWAFFNQINPIRGGQNGSNIDGIYLIDYRSSGVIKVKQNRQWPGKVADVCAEFEGLVQSLKPKIVVLEFPEIWSGNAASMQSAQRGDLFKLAYLIGGLGEIARRSGARMPVLVFPREWKGQLPKDIVIKRIEHVMELKPKDHEADAIGMGLAAQGLL
jgi:Holliday junction resolvasome RuvABC endonuclease subunit